MTVYIEYAFLENFLYDGILLWLACKASKASVRKLRLAFSAALGGVFAVAFPLLRLSKPLATLLKLCVGLLLCMPLFKRLKSKKEWGRYALTASFFFIFTFGFGGALLGVLPSQSSVLRKIPSGIVMIGFAALTVISLILIEKLYQRRVVHRFIYDCAVSYNDKTVRVRGFYDSGNTASKCGIPVCFLSPDVVFELWENVEQGEQVRDEIAIATVTGEKKTPLYKGELKIRTETGERVIKEVYFAISTNMISREYKMILHSRIFD